MEVWVKVTTGNTLKPRLTSLTKTRSLVGLEGTEGKGMDHQTADSKTEVDPTVDGVLERHVEEVVLLPRRDTCVTGLERRVQDTTSQVKQITV